MSRLADPVSIFPGRATGEGTARYRSRFPALDPGHFRIRLDLWLSSIGEGTYLGESDSHTDSAYTEAVACALESGCNVVDSAINYRFQRSERAIGEALSSLFTRGALRRDEVVICTKGGYLAFDGGPPSDPRDWVYRTFVEPGIISWDDIVAYNVMHPAYLRHELEASLHNLRLQTIDVYYLHNPEAQLEAVDRAEFRRRMTACFGELERAVAEGKIGVYGTATWSGYRVTPESAGYLSLEDLVAAAHETGGDHHHFRVIQLPVNLAMREAFVVENQRIGGDCTTALAAAARLGIVVFGSASLLQAELATLPPEMRRRLHGFETDAQCALQFARSTPGVSCALVGMKSRAHVEENLRVAARPPLSGDEFAGLFH